jgi:stage IV sporulation protein FB
MKFGINLFKFGALLSTALLCFYITGEPLWQIAILALSAAVHECAHIIALKLCRKNFSASSEPFGVRIHTKNLSYAQEAIVLASGPAANLLFAVICLVILKERQSPPALLALYSNMTLGLFNLLPISSFDGGNLLKLLLDRLSAPPIAYSAAKIISISTVAVLWIGGIYAILTSYSGGYLVFMSLWLISADA